MTQQIKAQPATKENIMILITRIHLMERENQLPQFYLASIYVHHAQPQLNTRTPAPLLTYFCDCFCVGRVPSYILKLEL